MSDKLGQCLCYSSQDMRLTQLEITRLQKELKELREALEKLSTCEDDSSWGDWVRGLASEALHKVGGGEK